MEPAIKSGSVLVVSRLRYGLRFPWSREYLILWALPKAGEVLVFYTPAGEKAVKRCAAMPGYGALSDDAAATALAVNNSFYAQGDNSLASYDSRSYGPVPVDNIIGKVLGR